MIEKFKTLEEVDSWLKQMQIKNYHISEHNKDTYDKKIIVMVDGSVNLASKELKYLPVNFSHVIGSFYIENNQLSSFDGFPDFVRYDFDCSNNQFTTLEGSPLVADNFYCSENPLVDLNGIQKFEGKFISYSKKEMLIPMFKDFYKPTSDGEKRLELSWHELQTIKGYHHLKEIAQSHTHYHNKIKI